MNLIKRSFFMLFTVLLTGSLSCSEDLPECPSKMCIMAGSWKLVEAHADNTLETQDLTIYRLTLHNPVPADNTTADFSRTQVSGLQDNGSWSVVNNGGVLRLVPGNNSQFTEDWVIERFTLRQLILVMNRNTDIKQGPSRIRLVLEPVNF